MTHTVKIGWVLRDMMQSTGVWTFDSDILAHLVKSAAKVGFSHLEVGGGQSYQIALQHGFNPYQIIRLMKRASDECGADIPLQVLLRGANQFGFHHFSQSTQKKNIDLLVDAGGDKDKSKALIIRNFDALNDPENLRFSIEYMVKCDQQAALANDKRIHIQAALSYVAPLDLNNEDVCYSNQYYVNYAKALSSIAKGAGGALDSLCIKDMSGQLSAQAVQNLVSSLKKLELPVFLHCHSTDEAQSMSVQVAAAQAGIDGIEVAIEPLAGGASHNDVENLAFLDRFQLLDVKEIKVLKDYLKTIFFEESIERKDMATPLGHLKKLVSVGIPGGAIPFVLQDLQANVAGMLGISLDEALLAFVDELSRLQGQLGSVPLVTPTADIIAKQTIKSLGNRARTANYQLMDPRFCRLVLGHYGRVVNHATGQLISPSSELVNEVKAYCDAIEIDQDGERIHAGKNYPEPVILNEHPAKQQSMDIYIRAVEYVEELYGRYPASCENFGTVEECIMMHVMRPAGKTDRLLVRNILWPTEDRLRFILDRTLHLLPGMVIPESRQQIDNEETDMALLNELGDYDGIVSNIKDLVLRSEPGEIGRRLKTMMQKIVALVCDKNSAAKENRYYIERRFLALFSAAVFWDLQRICRRTGGDSRKDIDEMTANSLGKIISTTLRKRQQDGLGKPKSYLI